ncbi:(2Fe-2S)-binding protein [Longispora albida]|uniref:(2Fe-2S)-binding protein n=1 Tax=Longispora albida TaxID=203523 RepID=UPI000367BE33|nr:(2Fe-2S)-binding protein [Longispora albida]
MDALDAHRGALREAARFSQYFEVLLDGDPGDWRPVSGLYSGELTGELIAAVGERLWDPLPGRMPRAPGEPDRRIAASLMFQGYAAKLWSPLLACVVTGGVLPRLGPGGLSWRYRTGEPVSLLAAEVSAGEPDAAGLYSAVVADHLVPLAEAVQATVPVSGKVLWGNAASALHGAAGMLARSGHSPAAIVAQVLGTGLLAGTTTGLPVTAGFRRRSCCLYYRVPNSGGTCGDCVLRTVRSG